jgi:hypothetical protein
MVQLNDEERVLWSAKPLKMPFLAGLFVVVPLGLGVFFVVTYLVLISQVWSALFIGFICLGIFVFFIPLTAYKDWKTTEYVVTNQRVFFDTMMGYAIVNLTDVQNVFVRTGFLDRFYGTGKVFVSYRDFQPTTKYWKPGGNIIVNQGYPSFTSIKDTQQVKDLILDAAAQVRIWKANTTKNG